MKVLVGTVVSDKMMKSATVEVTQTWIHPKYKKTIKKTKKYIVHNNADAQVGDVVQLHETRPMSKSKRFVIAQVVAKATK